VNARPGTEPEAESQLQARSPAQKDQNFTGTQEQSLSGHRAPTSMPADWRPGLGVAILALLLRLEGNEDATRGGQEDEEDAEVGEGGGGQIAQQRVGKYKKIGGQAAQVISLSAAHHQPRSLVGKTVKPAESTPDDLPTNEQEIGGQAAQWLKGILPDVSSGWWEVDDKGQDRGFVIKFRCRTPDRQTLTFPRVTGGQFDTLRQSSHEEARRMIGEQIAGHLYDLSLNPAKRAKAQLAAQKLGIDLKDYKAAGAGN